MKEKKNIEDLLIRVKGISLGVFVSGEHEVAEAENALSQSSKLHVSRFKCVLPVLSKWPLCAVNHNGAASLKDTLGSTWR